MKKIVVVVVPKFEIQVIVCDEETNEYETAAVLPMIAPAPMFQSMVYERAKEKYPGEEIQSLGGFYFLNTIDPLSLEATKN